MDNTVILKLLVPHAQFGPGVSADTWREAEKSGVIAILPFPGVVQFFWYALCGWSFVNYDADGVLFAKQAIVNFE